VPRVSETSAPLAERPLFPDGYGLPTSTEGMLAWADVEARLVSSVSYGAPTTVHAQNLATNPACSLNLESGTEAVIVEGESHATSAPADGLGARIAEAFAKYHDLGYRPAADAWAGEAGGGLRVLTPKRALAWFTFPTDATRFRFG
jgi:hypothetical protein